MSLTVLGVAYPFAPVGLDTAGGAEQVLAQVDRALVAAGHRSIVVACEGSRIAGELVPVPATAGPLTPESRAAAHARHRDAIEATCRRERIDVMHLHGVDVASYLPPSGPPAAVVLHLPPDWYPRSLFETLRPATTIVPVSRTQAARCPPSAIVSEPIANGIDVESFSARHARRGYALVLARICPEKGIHLAIDAARRAGMPLLIAGELFPYPEHRAYFEEVVAPQLGDRVRWLGPVGFARKRRLLSAARCVLVPSLAEETSSLVAREAAACGTPVIAFRRGALPETVEDGRTGILVDDVDDMSDAMLRVAAIGAEACRDTARRRFALKPMTDAYLALFERLARPAPGAIVSAPALEAVP